MDPERWKRVEDLFHRVLELDAAERASFLETACAGDVDLRAQLDRLLRGDVTSHRLVDRFEDGGLLPSADPLIGREVGPYRLTSLVGVGGMGVVYRAERTDGAFDREVAIKLIRVELATPNLVRRFEAERRTLAALSHPNVAQLLDGGTTADGRPYLVMELVRGVPIDRFCDERRLSIDERLRLFVQVCAGVHYAHQNLVVHRDLKPGNVLVDDTGTPKLLDFGIARLLAETSPLADSMTLTGGPIVTPDYASPEQLLLGPVTTAMDVYALGVVLYELLAGRRPFQSENLPPIEWQRAVIERAPTRPSTAVLVAPIVPSAAPGPPVATRYSVATNSSFAREGPLPSVTVDVAGRRRSTPRALARRLRGDIDRIVLMALRKEPERRYASAKELAEDVEAHLAGLPVRARPDSFLYRATKFVRRNRVAVALAAAVLVSLLLGIVLSRRAEQRARAQALHARIEADSFQRTGEFLLDDLLGSTDATDSAAIERQRRTIQEQAARVRREQSEEPHLRANLLDALGRMAQRLAAFDDAEALVREAFEIRERSFGPSNLETALSMRSLGRLQIARGEPVPAAEVLARALRLHRERAEETHTDVASVANDLAEALRELGRLDEAEALAKEALGLRRAADERSLAVAESLELLGRIARDRDEVENAGARFEEALALRRAIVGTGHVLVLQSACDLAAVLATKGDEIRSRALFDEAESGARALRYAGVDVLIRVLVARAEAEKPERARARIDEALALQTARLGPDHADVARTIEVDARLARLDPNRWSGGTEEIRALWSRVLAIRRKAGASPWLLGLSLSDASDAWFGIGRSEEVHQMMAESVKLLGAPGITRTRAYEVAESAYRDFLLFGDGPFSMSIY